ncbi:hypothetical protein JVX92_00565 [Microbacterium hominis]|uniref:hypothetical protein n=1 Tax=Microbacterium hominis TaxID=162426 RepID=UPI001962DFA3|nr:hypothetical protein [Microbacterium hominis]QRY40821.1 hypothetical protein JVX92_00565 [Microbacterium hominis]
MAETAVVRIAAEYEPATPVGVRVGCGHFEPQRKPRNRWLNEVSAAGAEIAALRAGDLSPKMTDAEHEEYVEQLRELMLEARDGLITLGVNGTGRELHGVILELKPRLEVQTPVFNRDPYLLRLYFGEPRNREACLLPLMLAAKAPRELGLAEQTIHIQQSIARAHQWAADQGQERPRVGQVSDEQHSDPHQQ